MKAIGIVLAAFVAAGCAALATPGTPAPSQSPALTASDTPVSSPTEGPTAATEAPTAASATVPSRGPTPPPDLPRGAVKEVDGIRVSIELQRNPMPAGTPSWVKVSVTNRGQSNVTWLHDGCASLADVGGQSAAAWPVGRAQSGQDAKFKAYALGGSIVAEPPPFAQISFVPENFLGKGSYGCADIGIEETLKPGESRQQTRWWSGYEAKNRTIPPPGQVKLSVSAGFYWRGKEPDELAGTAIAFTLPGWIDVVDDATRLSPPEVVDAALSDPGFTAFLQKQDIGNGREAIAWYRSPADVWEVGLLIWYDYGSPRIRGVQVDPVSGAILGSIDRAWNQDADGFP